MKKYENPMLQVVSISKNDIIVTSINTPTNGMGNGTQLAPDRRKSIWD